MNWEDVGRKMAVIAGAANKYVNDPEDKMRLLHYAPVDEDLMDALSELYAIRLGMDDIDENDERELEELDSAYETALKRLRLAFYRAGKDPQSPEFYGLV